MNVLSVCSGIGAPNRRIRNLVGHRNGRLSVTAFSHVDDTGRAHWLCKCDCGGERVVQSNNLTRDTGTKSCGCLRREASAKRRQTEGVWNDGKSYAIQDGKHCYRTRRSWAKAAIRQYGNQCSRCGWDRARCDVHHRKPKAKGGLHTISNAVVLCPNCHREEHERGSS
jgi:hypothetical protein